MVQIGLNRISILWYSCLIPALATWPGCLVSPVGGGGGPGSCDNPMSVPLAASDSWSIISGESAAGDAILISGFGDSVEGILLANGDAIGDENTQFCLSLAPASEATFEFDGTNLTLSAMFADDVSGETCTIDLTGTVEQSGTRDFFGNNYNLGCTFGLDAQGTAVFPGREIAIDALDLLLLRPDACTPALLAEQPWILANVNPDFQPLSYFSDAVTINVSGTGTAAEFALVYTGGEDIRFLCSEESLTAAFSFDGTTLTLSAELDGSTDDGSPDGTTCSLEFTGTAAACERSGVAIEDQIIRLVGAGSYTTPEISGDLPVLYLNTFSPEEFE